MASRYITLHLWVRDQVGCERDCTSQYVDDTRWRAPDGVRLDVSARDGVTLSGPRDRTWRAYLALAERVASGGHGDGTEGAPVLTACPDVILRSREEYRAELARYARYESTQGHPSWGSYAEACGLS